MDIFGILVWCATFILAATALPQNLLYDHKSAILLRNLDDTSSQEIRLKVPIVFYGVSYSSIFVNSNGLLSFQTEIPNFFNTEFPLDYPVIAPLYSNVDTTGAGEISYYETTDRRLLSRATSNVQTSFLYTEDFEAESLFIVTWNNVGYHRNGTDKVNTFQVAIASDGEESYAEFLYPENGIQWIQGSGDVSGLPDARAQAGFVSDDGKYKLLPGSGTDQVKNLVRWSNMNIPGQWIFRIGELDELDVDIAEPDLNGASGLAEPKTCAKAISQCHSQATCTDFPEGFCCQCKKNYYGNGKYCIKSDIPLRVNGKVNGIINDEFFTNLDLQSYIVMVDGRAYTAISKIPKTIAQNIQTMQILGATIGWLFAKPVSNAMNGYQVTGGVFNQTATIKFPNSNDEVIIRQKFFGLDVFDQLKLESEMKGTIPILPEDAKVIINEYQEQYRITSPGVIQSTTTNEIRYTDSKDKEVVIPYTITQTILFDYCKYDSIPVDTTWKLRVGKNFISYEFTEQIIRFGMSNKVGPIGDVDPCEEGKQHCGPNSSCVVERDNYRCICNPGYQSIYRDNVEVCEDLNECLAGLHECDFNSECINEIGSYRCICDPGFEGDGKVCQNALTCQRVQCPENSQCVEDGVARCECLPGFTGHFKHCTPLTTFSCHISNNCSPFGYCVIDPSTNEYSCVCLPGYNGDGYSCIPIPTTTTTTPAPTTEATIPTPRREPQKCVLGTCWCPFGFEKEPNSKFCLEKGPDTTTQESYLTSPVTDATGTELAKPIPICFNSKCSCPFLYSFNETTKECFYSAKGDLHTKGPSGITYSCDTLNNCHKNAECVANFYGKYECICEEGYEGDGYDCKQTELSCAREDICHAHAECKYNENLGKSECVCNQGYVGNGIACLPVDTAVCSDDSDCPINEVCKFTMNAQCVCKDGFVRDSQHTCVSLEGNCGGGTCAENAECIYDEEYETHYCACSQGFDGDGITECKKRPAGCNVLNDCGLHAHCEFIPQESLYQCKCDIGFFGDGYFCYSVKNCQYDKTLCDRNARCILKNNEYECECNPGYRGNGSICQLVPKHDGNYLLLNQGMATLKVPFDESKGKGKPIQIKYNQIAVGLDVDCIEGRVYWSDVSGRAIRSSLYNGTNRTDFIVKDIGSPEGLAIDFVSRNIYWTDSSKDTIEVANLESRLRKTLFNTGLVNPRGIAVHPQRGKIFWTDWDRREPKIEWANMDGTGREIFLKGKDVQLPNALAINYESEEVCYTDAGTKKIECIDIDSKEKKTLMENCTYPFGLAITRDTIFYSDWISKKVERISKHTLQKLKPLSVPLGGSGNKLYGLTSVTEECPPLTNVCFYYEDQCRPGYICMPNGLGTRRCVCATQVDPPYENSCNQV